MSDITDQEWDCFVESHPDATFFHRADWRHVAKAVFGHKPHYLTVREGGSLTAVLPLVEVRSRLFGHALISNAFCVGGGPLATNKSSLETILHDAEKLGRRLQVDYIELRDTPQAAQGWIERNDLYAGFEGPIAADPEANLMQIPKRQRAVLRKALERGLTTTIDASPADFFALYARTMRGHGTPALPRRFFERLLSTFGNDCEIQTVHQDGRPISSVLSYFFRGRVLPYYTGSHPDARNVGSNDLLHWALMRRGIERGCTIFDFGRSKIGTGPYNYKRNWGFQPRPITHQYHLVNSDTVPNLNPTNPKYAAFIQAWRRLPLPVATAVSPFLSRSLA